MKKIRTRIILACSAGLGAFVLGTTEAFAGRGI